MVLRRGWDRQSQQVGTSTPANPHYCPDDFGYLQRSNQLRIDIGIDPADQQDVQNFK
jgi:hypothetical protein